MQEDYAELLAAIKAGAKHRLQEVYTAYRQEFVSWARSRFRCDASEALDVYQEVMLVFYENIMEGKIDRLRSQLRTYLFGIGRILLLERFRKASRYADLPEYEGGLPVAEAVANHRLELTERQEMLRQAIDQLGERCRDLLLLIYYHRYTTEAAMHELDYKNKDVLKSQKARCMRQLRNWIETHWDKDLI
jgi:RNA polymerase sigma factor (sigma-70 family)